MTQPISGATHCSDLKGRDVKVKNFTLKTLISKVMKERKKKCQGTQVEIELDKCQLTVTMIFS